MSIHYQPIDETCLEAVKDLYRQHQWAAYLGDDDKLRRALRNSSYLLGAFDGATLAGFVRCEGDGEHVVLVQDLIVAKAYQRRGIGAALLQQASERYQHVRALYIVTDLQDADSNAFYRAQGWRTLQDVSCVGYIR